MAGPLTSIMQRDLSGGEVPVMNPFDLKENQSQQVINLQMDEHGSLRTRDGTLIQKTSPTTTIPINKIYDLILVNGTQYRLVMHYDAANGVNKLYNASTTPWTFLGNAGVNNRLPDIVTFVNRAIVCNSKQDNITYFDGTTYGQILMTDGVTKALRGCQHLATHLASLWAWNTDTASTAAGALQQPSGPSSLCSSNVNDVNTWPLINQTYINKDDGTQGQGIGLFTIAETGISPTATLIAFKDFTAYQVTSAFGASTFSVQKVKSDMGCIAPRSIQFLSGFGLIRLTHRGFALYDGVNDTLISEEERPRLFGVGNYTGIDWTNAQFSYATQVPNPPLYICACPVSGASLTRVFVYDLVRRSWCIFTYANAISTWQLLLDPNVVPVVMGGDYTGGNLRRYFSGDTTDDGTAISWQWNTKPAFAGSPMDRAYFRRVSVEAAQVAQGATITAQFFESPAGQDSIANQTRTVPSYDTTNVDTTLSFDIGRKANSLYVQLTGTGNWRLRGLEWHVRRMALTRSTLVTAS